MAPGGGNADDEVDHEELPLLRQPDQPHGHLTPGVAVAHHEVLAGVVEGRRPRRPDNGDGGADAPARLLGVVQQGQRHDAAVLRRRGTSGGGIREGGVTF